MLYIFNDVLNVFSNQETIKVANVSELWKCLRTCFIRNLSERNFSQISSFLESTSLLDSWFTDRKIQARLFENDMELIFDSLINDLNHSNFQLNTLIFQCLVQLMAHSESNKENIQQVLSLPWIRNESESMEIDDDLKALANSLDFNTKLKCLEAICRYGTGKSRLDLLKECVSNPNVIRNPIFTAALL